MGFKLMLLTLLAAVGLSLSGCFIYGDRGYGHDYGRGGHHDRDYDHRHDDNGDYHHR